MYAGSSYLWFVFYNWHHLGDSRWSYQSVFCFGFFCRYGMYCTVHWQKNKGAGACQNEVGAVGEYVSDCFGSLSGFMAEWGLGCVCRFVYVSGLCWLNKGEERGMGKGKGLILADQFCLRKHWMAFACAIWRISMFGTLVEENKDQYVRRLPISLTHVQPLHASMYYLGASWRQEPWMVSQNHINSPPDDKYRVNSLLARGGHRKKTGTSSYCRPLSGGYWKVNNITP